MSITVFALVLAAAFMHAAWNGLVKLRLEPVLTMALITSASGLIALPASIVLGLPSVDSWPWLAGSIALHLASYITLTEAYRHAEMGQVYPIARGSAPLLTTLASTVILGESVAPLAGLGIVVLCCGVALVAFSRGGGKPPVPSNAVAYAALTALTIAGYTIVDGMGARVSQNAHAYSATLFAIDGVPFIAFVLWTRGVPALRAMRPVVGVGLLGGLFSLGSYWIAIWAMTVAPIPLVAATRETSILFAILISVAFLREPMIAARAVAAIIIVTGIVTIRLS